MKNGSYPSMIALGISVLGLTSSLAHAGRLDEQDTTPGNALNPRTVTSVVERDPDGMGITERSRTPTGLLTVSPSIVKAPSATPGGLLYRATVEFGGIGLSGDKDAAKFREYKDLDSGAYLNTFSLMIEKPKSAFHFDALGGGVARKDQYYGVDVGRYNTWRVRGSFGETPHVFTTTFRIVGVDGVGEGGLT